MLEQINEFKKQLFEMAKYNENDEELQKQESLWPNFNYMDNDG